MSEPRLPAPERWLLDWTLRGEGSEFLLGDLLERYQDDRERGRSAVAARMRLQREMLAALWAWWSPRAIRRRRHDAHHGLGRLSARSSVLRVGRWGVGGWRQDLAMAFRGLVRKPRFAIGVALTLGVGIGATTTIYSVVDGVLLRPLPYAQSERIVAVGAMFPGREWEEGRRDLQHLAGISLANLQDFRDRTQSVEELAAIERTSVLLPDVGEGPELVAAAEIGGSFFSLLGVRPALGRTFFPEEETTATQGVVLLSFDAWRTRFGSDPSVVGQTLGRFGGGLTVVGVLPADFKPPEAFFATPPEFWLPLRADHSRYADRGRRSLAVLGRLRPGVTLDAARAEAGAVAAALAEAYPEGNVYPDGTHLGIGVNVLLDQTVGTSARTLRMFLIAAALLLALSGLNAATLMLARALERVRELEIRMALGSGRWRVMRLLLGEALVLALIGGLLGVALAHVGVATFTRYAPSSIPRLGDIVVDARILGVAFLLAGGAGLAAGLLPALRLSGSERRRVSYLRSRSRPQGVGRVRSLLVSSQMTLAMVLVSSAALLFTSFVRIRITDPGFDAQGLTTLNVPLKRPGAPDLEPWQDWDRLLAELASVPGVVAVAGTTDAPFRSPSWAPRLLLPGDAEDVRHEGIAGFAVTPGYFRTLGTDVLQGREFRDSDGPEGEAVALVNAAFVRRELDGRSPLGLPVRLIDGDSDRTVRIVGVVEDVVQTRIEEGRQPALYVPHRQVAWTSMEAVVRTDAPPATVAQGLRDAARRFNPVLPPRAIRTMSERMATTRLAPRFHALLIGAFAGVAALLAALGLYGVLAQAVGERRQELGVRMALGANGPAVVRLVVRGGLVIAGWGVMCGLVASLVAGRLLATFLYEVRPGDPRVLGGTGLALLVAALCASWLPARRAAAVDPMRVLREE